VARGAERTKREAVAVKSEEESSEFLRSERASSPARDPRDAGALTEVPLLAMVLLSLVVHGLIVVAVNAVDTSREPAHKTALRPILVEVTALSAIAAEPPRAEPSAVEARGSAPEQNRVMAPRAAPPRPARPRTPEAAPPEPSATPAPAPAPAATPSVPVPEPTAPVPAAAEPSVPAPVSSGALSAAAGSGSPTGSAAVAGQGTGAGGSPVRASGAQGPSDADRLRAQRLYVRSLEDLIRAHTRYPRAAARAGLEGRVVLGLRIARDGTMVGLRVATSSQHDLLDEAALEAAREVEKLPPPPALAGIQSRDEVLVGVVYVVR
jgi:protein TonB